MACAVNAGVSAELIFAAVEKKTQLVTSQASANNKEYISRPVEYKEGDLVDDEKRGVMMMWEKPIMEVGHNRNTGANGQGEGQRQRAFTVIYASEGQCNA